MDMIVVFGPPAVGKMTVGMELQKKLGYKLFHNHMVIELVYNFFDYGEGPFWNMVSDFRSRIFQEVKNSNPKGLVFTYVWALDENADKEELEKYCQSFGKEPKDVKFIELYADQETRLERNISELRLKEKRSKHNFEQSENFLINADREYQLNSKDDFFYPNHIRIDNSKLSAEDTANIAIKHFSLTEE